MQVVLAECCLPQWDHPDAAAESERERERANQNERGVLESIDDHRTLNSSTIGPKPLNVMLP